MDSLIQLVSEQVEKLEEDTNMELNADTTRKSGTEVSVDRVLTEAVIIKSVLDFWKNSSQHSIITVEKLLHHRELLHPQTLISYLFAHNKVNPSFTTWEMIRVTIEYLITKTVRAYRLSNMDDFKLCLDDLRETLFMLLKV
jgi:hypothetical protein